MRHEHGSDHDGEYAEAAIAERRNAQMHLAVAVHGQECAGDWTPDQEARYERQIIASILRVWPAQSAHEDGRNIVCEAVSENFDGPVVRELAEIIHAHFKNNYSIEPDFCEIGRKFTGLVVDYAKRVARREGDL